MTDSGNLTKEELLSLDLRIRQDSTHTYLEAHGEIDGQKTTVELARVTNRERRPQAYESVAALAEGFADRVQEMKDRDDDEQTASAL